MKRYAEGTGVSVERTRGEIEKLVRSRGAVSFGSLSTTHAASFFFDLKGRRVRFEIPVPRIADPGKRDAEERRRWRCLLLSVKAKFEAVANEIVTFDEEFLAHIVVPGGNGETTVGDRLVAQIAEAYGRGLSLPPLLPGGPS